jgi:hypothetical protein
MKHITDGRLNMTTADENDETCDIKYQLDCGRWVTVEECYISQSTLGVLAGSMETIRRHLIEEINVNKIHLAKPVPDELPNFLFKVHLVSGPISDEGSGVTDPISGREIPHYDGSKLVVCWLSNDITTSLPELIKRETRSIEWNKYAEDFNF